MSTVQANPYWSLVTRTLLVAAILLGFSVHSFAQSSDAGKPPANPSDGVVQPKKDSDPRFGSPENEMRTKMILKEEKKRYEENLGRAREVSDLASQLSKGYERNKSFSPDDNKRLERLEKLTKRIRNEAGGSDSEAGADLKDICDTMLATLKHLAEMAEELQKLVDKTPRQVVSAAVIDQANRLITITQHLRSSR